MKAVLLVGALGVAGCSCRSSSPTAAEEAYSRGQADAVKRLYWAKQALEAPGLGGPAGRIMYYTWTDRGGTADGRQLAPAKVAVPVFIPDPVPSGSER